MELPVLIEEDIRARIGFTLLRLYGPLEPWFDKTWRPGEIEEVTNR
jgi:hypothetical protein